MDWLVDLPNRYETEIAFLSKLDKITLYDHNAVIKKNLEKLTFSCVLNCKRLNRQYSILGKVEGDLFTQTVQISCALVDFNRIVVGKWQHQKIELTKFAYRYNQKSTKITSAKVTEDNTNYQIKVNPLSGEFYVCYHFLLGFDLIKDYEMFKIKMTDECQRLTSECEKIFNTIVEVIFDQEANDPYLKSDEKVGMHYSRPVKVSKLLKKIKKLNTISNFYKIKHDIAAQNKYRSVFKKIYLKKNERCINNPTVIDNALLFIPKFCKKHLDALPENAQPAKRKNLIITPFEDLEDNHELEFATRHLEDLSKPRGGESIIELNHLSAEEKNSICQPGIYQVGGLTIRVEKIEPEKKEYEYELLAKVNFKYEHIMQYYRIEGEEFNSLRITEYLAETSLQDYLHNYGYTISLAARLDIMTQISHVVEVLHKFHIGYFVDFNNIYITEGNVVKIKNFTSAFSVMCWDETKMKEKIIDKKYLMPDYKDFLIVCGYSKADDSSSRMEDEGGEKEKAKFENERADVFCLAMVLYKILMGKFPFSPNCISIYENHKKIDDFLNEIWTVETEFFLRQGGLIVKLLAHLILKCFHMETEKRPYVEWITVILSEVKSSLESLY